MSVAHTSGFDGVAFLRIPETMVDRPSEVRAKRGRDAEAPPQANKRSKRATAQGSPPFRSEGPALLPRSGNCASEPASRAQRRDPVGRPRRPRRKSWADEAVYLAMRGGCEEDSHRIAQRQKQIDYGKNTLAYDTFVEAVPRENRTREHPATPPPRQRCSKRSFDGQVKKWRRMLHEFKEKHDGAKASSTRSNRTCESPEIHIQASAACVESTDVRASEPGRIAHAVEDNPRAASIAVESNDREMERSKSETESEYVSDSDLDDIELDDNGNLVQKASAALSPTDIVSTATDSERNARDSADSSECAAAIFGKF